MAWKTACFASSQPTAVLSRQAIEDKKNLPGAGRLVRVTYRRQGGAKCGRGRTHVVYGNRRRLAAKGENPVIGRRLISISPPSEAVLPLMRIDEFPLSAPSTALRFPRVGAGVAPPGSCVLPDAPKTKAAPRGVTAFAYKISLFIIGPGKGAGRRRYQPSSFPNMAWPMRISSARLIWLSLSSISGFRPPIPSAPSSASAGSPRSSAFSPLIPLASM